MASRLEIEVLPLARQRFRIQLGDNAILMVIWWAPETATWFFSILRDDEAGTPILLGRQMRPRVSLVRNNDFIGDMYIVHPAAAAAPAFDRQAWGNGWKIYYRDPPLF